MQARFLAVLSADPPGALLRLDGWTPLRRQNSLTGIRPFQHRVNIVIMFDVRTLILSNWS